jgi:hypothetical protein
MAGSFNKYVSGNVFATVEVCLALYAPVERFRMLSKFATRDDFRPLQASVWQVQ